MGVVWQAEDLRLGRQVALKFLNPEQTRDELRRARFIQEARSASSLNHPNIITIYEIDTFQGQDFIVMELVAGKTLDHVIPRGGLPVSDTLKYAIAICSALTASHVAGIVHRDIKPSNVIIGANGALKVVDFGLAKLTAGDDSSGADETRTIKTQTEEGVILGTAAYMSPEQAQGKRADARSDIFSVGVVLYEMATGRRPFDGPNRMSTLAAILQQEPRAPTELDQRIPRELERVILRCLRKDPDRRFQNIADLKVALDELKEETESGRMSGEAPRLPASKHRKQLVTAAATVAALCAIGTAGWAVFRHTRASPTRFMLTRITEDGRSFNPDISRDGKMIAYLSSPEGMPANVWVRQTAGGSGIQITHESSDVYAVTISPDGSRVLFSRPNGTNRQPVLYQVPALGGDPMLVALNAPIGAWLPDGSIFFSDTNGHIFLLPGVGSKARPVDPDLTVFATAIAPKGSEFMVVGYRPGKREADLAQWFLMSIPDGKLTVVKPPLLSHSQRTAPLPQFWVADRDEPEREWIGYSEANIAEGSNLYRSRINAQGQVASDIERLTFSTGLMLGANGAADGTIVFTNGILSGNLWQLPIDTNAAKVTGEARQITNVEGTTIENAEMSRDGSKIVYAKRDSIYILELRSGHETKLVEGISPAVSPDGSFVLYARIASPGKEVLYSMGVSGGEPRRICELKDMSGVKGFSSDGRHALVQIFTNGRDHIVLVDLATGEVRNALDDARQTFWHAYYSWDDKWMTFIVQPDRSTERDRIYITPVTNGMPAAPTQWIPLTSGDFWVDKPALSPDGNVLYFTSNRDGFPCYWAQKLNAVTKRPAGAPVAVHHMHGQRPIPEALSSGSLLSRMELCVSRDRIMMSTEEFRSDVWMLVPGTHN